MDAMNADVKLTSILHLVTSDKIIQRQQCVISVVTWHINLPGTEIWTEPDRPYLACALNIPLNSGYQWVGYRLYMLANLQICTTAQNVTKTISGQNQQIIINYDSNPVDILWFD